MSRNLLLAFGVLAALGVVAFFAFQDSESAADGLDRSLVAHEPEGLSPTKSEDEALPAVEQAGAGAAQAPVASGTQQSREEVAAVSELDSFKLTVVDESMGSVVGAEVWAAHATRLADEEALEDISRVDEVIEQEGARYVSGTDGIVRLPKAEEGKTFIVARKGDLWGFTKIASAKQEKDEHLLVLKRDVILRVQVINAAGKPQSGVTVVVEKDQAGMVSQLWKSETAGSEGIAVFPHAQHEIVKSLIRSSASEADDGDGQARVSVDAMTKQKIRRDVDTAAMSGELIVLSLPAMGSLNVRVLDERLELHTRSAKATLEYIPEGEPRVLSPFNHKRREKVSQTIENGVGTFPFVEIGLDLSLAVSRNSSQIKSSLFVEGPRRPGEVVQVEVQLGADHPVARLRALDGSGQPLAETVLECEVGTRTTFMNNKQGAWPRTDKDGFFVVDMEMDWIEGSSRILTVILPRADTGRPSATLDLSRKLEVGINELGDIVLAQALVFAKGRVQGATGGPMASVPLALRSQSDSDSGWEENYNFKYETEPDGSFEITEAFPGTAFQIAANGKEHAGSWVEFQRGDRNILIVLQAEGQVAGRVLVGPGIPLKQLRVAMYTTSDSDEYRHHSDREVSLATDGSFLLRQLMPGKRELQLLVKQQNDSLFTASDLIVRAGEVCRDPRVNDIDLRGRLFFHQIELLGIGGGSSSGNVAFGAPGSKSLNGRMWLRDNNVQILCEHEYLDVLITVPGYRPERLSSFKGKGSVTLRKGVTVTLALTGSAVLPDPPIFVKATLIPAEDTDNVATIDWSGSAFDETHEIKSRVAQPGRMKVEWIVERRTSGASVATSVKLEREQIFDVLDIAEGQRFEISLTAEEMDEIVGSLK